MPHVRVVPYPSFCVQCLLLYQDWAKFFIILMIPEPCSTHQYLYARWSTLSDRFRIISFTMQLHDQNSTLSLTNITWKVFYLTNLYQSCIVCLWFLSSILLLLLSAVWVSRISSLLMLSHASDNLPLSCRLSKTGQKNKKLQKTLRNHAFLKYSFEKMSMALKIFLCHLV